MHNTSIWQKLKNGDYPILMLEWRRLLRAKLQYRITMVLGVIVSLVAFVGLLLGYAVSSKVQFLDLPIPAIAAYCLLVLFRWVVLYLSVPIACSRSVVQERESGSLQLLALTPMSTSSIFGQKLAAGVAPALLMYVLALPTLIPSLVGSNVSMFGTIPWMYTGTDVVGAITYPVQALSFAAVGLWCSCACVSGRSATMLTYLLIIFALPMVASLIMLPLTLGYTFSAMNSFTPPTSPNLVIPASMLSWMTVMRLVQVGISAAIAVLFSWLAIRKLDWMRKWIGGGR